MCTVKHVAVVASMLCATALFWVRSPIFKDCGGPRAGLNSAASARRYSLIHGLKFALRALLPSSLASQSLLCIVSRFSHLAYPSEHSARSALCEVFPCINIQRCAAVVSRLAGIPHCPLCERNSMVWSVMIASNSDCTDVVLTIAMTLLFRKLVELIVWPDRLTRPLSSCSLVCAGIRQTCNSPDLSKH